MMAMSDAMRGYEARIKDVEDCYNEACRQDNVLLMTEFKNIIEFLHDLKAKQLEREITEGFHDE
jgi:hypothetical protein